MHTGRLGVGLRASKGSQGKDTNTFEDHFCLRVVGWLRENVNRKEWRASKRWLWNNSKENSLSVHVHV